MPLHTFTTDVFEASTTLRDRCNVDLAQLRRADCAWAKGIFLRAARHTHVKTYGHVLLRILNFIVHFVTRLNQECKHPPLAQFKAWSFWGSRSSKVWQHDGPLRSANHLRNYDEQR